MNVLIKKLSEKATIPTKGSKQAAGYDLYSTEDFTLYPGQRHLFKTDISMSFSEGYFARICPRSGLALKCGLDTLAGVIDSDFSGNWGVILINLSSLDSKEIKVGDKIAQAIFEKYEDVNFELVNDLPETERGENGYGSTDLKPNIS